MSRQEFYRQVYQEMKAGWKDSLRLYQEMVSDNIGSDSYVIDIGCGHADFLGVVYARAGNVYGIDPDLQALKNNMTIQQVVNGMADNIPFKDEYFDVVTCAWVLEHLENPEDVFNEIYRILKPGGKLIFLTPNALNYNVWIIRMIPNKLHSFFTRIWPVSSNRTENRNKRRLSSIPVITIALSQPGYHLRPFGIAVCRADSCYKHL